MLSSFLSKIITLGFCLVLLSIGAEGATVEPIDSGTNSGPLKAIMIVGELDYGDELKFANLALQFPNALVFLSSPGGNLVAGMEIGKAIRLRGYSTVVLKDSVCASACALAWLAGQKRLMQQGAKIGFHAAFTARSETPDGPANALVGAYLTQLGLPPSAIIYATEAQPLDMQWLTIEDAERVGIEVESFDVPVVDPISPPEPTADGREWIQIFSRSVFVDAIRLAEEYGERLTTSIAVFRYQNGWYGVVLGPYSSRRARNEADLLLSRGEIPSDSLITRGEKFVEMVWSRSFSSTPSSSSGPMTPPAKVVDALDEFFRTWSLPNDRALSRTRSLLAPYMFYFGKWLSRTEVMKEKIEFAERWPVRRYSVQRDSISIDCNSPTNCIAAGIVDWSAHSPTRKATSTGSASFEITFSRLEPPLIVSEESTVLSRSTASGAKATTPRTRKPTYRVGSISPGDTLKLRSGPGTQFPIVAEMRSGSRPVGISSCQTVLGYKLKWCRVSWRNRTGWASSCCLFDERTGRRAD